MNLGVYLKYFSLSIDIVFLMCIIFIYKKTDNIFDNSIIFLIFLFLFCYGQVFLFGLGVNKEKLFIFSKYNMEMIIRATRYFYFSILFYMIGFILAYNGPNLEKEEEHQYLYELKNSMKEFSTVLIVISIIPFFYILIITMYKSIMYGYIYNFDNPTEVNGIIGYISKFFIPALFLFLYTTKENKKIVKIITGLFIVICAMYLIRGSKGSGLTIIVGIVVFYNNFIKKFNSFEIIKVIPVIIIIVFIIPLISNFRLQADKNISGFYNSVEQVIQDPEENFIVKTISEMGGSMQAFILTNNAIPKLDNYKYGISYVYSILMIIPSIFLGGESFAEKAALDIWLMNIYKMSYGPGFSILAETYYNFGWYGGIVFTIFLGIFFTKIFNVNSENTIKNEIFKVLSFIFLYNSMLTARNPFHGIIRNLVYMYIAFYIVIYFLYNQKITKYKN